MLRAVFGSDPAFGGKGAVTNGADAEFCLFAFQANTQAPLLNRFRYAVVEVEQFEWSERIECH